MLNLELLIIVIAFIYPIVSSRSLRKEDLQQNDRHYMEGKNHDLNLRIPYAKSRDCLIQGFMFPETDCISF